MAGIYSGRVPALGIAVITADGTEIGRIKEVNGDCFKVDAPFQSDYWLATDAIGTATDQDVRLTLSRDELDQAKVDASGHSGFHRHE